MKSREIRRLELLLDKIEAGNVKSKVMRIRFSCLTKKTELG
jgi:hypothetical protein